MENTEEKRAINLATDLAASRQECDMLYRELSKVRDELITSKTERRVLSRWYEEAKAERDKLQVAIAELEAGVKASSKLVHAAEKERDKLHGELVNVRSALADVSAERDSLRTTIAAWESADTKPFLKVPDVADHVIPPVLPVPVVERPMCTTCHGCGGRLDQAYQGSDLDWLECGNMNCDRGMTAGPVEIGHPYYEPCKSDHLVRHE